MLGINYHGTWTDQTPAIRAGVLDRYAGAGVRWVRMDVAWASLQPKGPGQYDPWAVSQLDMRLNEVAARGMKALIVFYWPPKWSSGTTAKNGQPANPADYGRALGWAASRWAAQAPVWEMWNEPDLDDFWQSESPQQFAELLRGAYPIAKSLSPRTTFVAGAPTYVNTKWYKKLYKYGAGGMYDAFGVHPYVAPSNKGPRAKDNGTPWRMTHINSLVRLAAAHGEGYKQIWATEFGWSTAKTNSSNWTRGVTKKKQAKFLLAGMDVLGKMPQVAGAFWYTDRDTRIGNSHVDGYGLLTRDLTPKPAFYALRCAATSRC